VTASEPVYFTLRRILRVLSSWRTALKLIESLSLYGAKEKEEEKPGCGASRVFNPYWQGTRAL
jgi:hypothetical protein